MKAPICFFRPSFAGITLLSAVLASAGFTGCKRNAQSNAPALDDNPSTQQPSGSSPAEAQNSPASDGVRQYTLFRAGTVMTADGAIYSPGELLIGDDKIVAVGRQVAAPEGTNIVSFPHKFITPGIIDTHSHLGVYASPGLRAHSDGNEAVAPTTPYARAVDAYWPQDPQIDTARAGGVTTMQILPGSANLIGGQAVTVRLDPDIRGSQDAVFPGAPWGLKMACGENPKRVYGNKGGPQTRMGNAAGYRRAFQAASEYKSQWDRHRDSLAKWEKAGKSEDSKPTPPGFNAGNEALVQVLNGEALVHNHCYRADEMLMMLEIAKEFGFKIRSFHHAVEAYKIADVLAGAQTSSSVWADWWGFKAEAYDGILENAALISKAGAIAVIHSDDPQGIQRLNQEAAKAMYAGRRAGIDISEDEALRWITANAAWTLGIEDKTGTLTPGKLADVVVWDGHPFSVYTHAEQVYSAGKKIYDRLDPKAQPKTDFRLGLTPDAPLPNTNTTERNAQ